MNHVHHVHRSFYHGPDPTYMGSRQPTGHGMASLRGFSFLFLYCAMMVDADDMNHVLFIPFPRKPIGLPTLMECNVRDHIGPD